MTRFLTFLIGLWVILGFFLPAFGVFGWLFYIGSNKIAVVWLLLVTLPLSIGFADYFSSIKRR